MKIKYISFDFWNTLVEDNGPDHDIRENIRLKIIKNYINKFGYNIDNKKLIEHINKTWEYFIKIWKNEERTLTTEEILKHLFNQINLENYEDLEKLKTDISSLILKHPPSLTEDVLYDLIPKLSKNYKLYIISDTALTSGKHLKNILGNQSLLKYFSDFSFSDELGCSKPNKKIFINVINNPEKAKYLLHIGDIGRTDIKGAKKIGAKSIRYNQFNNAPHTKYKADYVMNTWSNFPILLKKLENL